MEDDLSHTIRLLRCPCHALLSHQCSRLLLNDVAKDLLDVCIVVYLDHIIIYSENVTAHTTYVLEIPRQQATRQR